MVDLLRLIDHGWLIVVYHEGWLLSRRPAFVTKASFYHEGQLLSRRLAFITKASFYHEGWLLSRRPAGLSAGLKTRLS
jgi:hypothetical protein